MGQLELHTELETADCFTRRNQRSDLTVTVATANQHNSSDPAVRGINAARQKVSARH